MTTLLAALIVFGVLITVHELGHFAAAKLVGMQVDEFAIGFGPKLYQTMIYVIVHEISVILIDYAVDKSRPGRLIQVIAELG